VPSKNNPAGRLYFILDSFRNHEDKTSIGNAWANVFELKSEETGDILLAISEVVKLTEEAKKQILAQDVNHKIYLRPFIEIQKIFALSHGHTLQNARPSLSDKVMSELEYSDDLLSRTIGENIIEEETLDELLFSVDELFEEVNKSNLPQDLKKLILNNLNNISWAVKHYKIHGAMGLKEAVDSAVGSFVIYSIYEHEIVEENDKEILAKYGKVITKAMSIVADAYTLLQLTAGAVNDLLPLLQSLN
jgi:hypothetical protein